MNYRSPFALDQTQRNAITAEELALHILKVLQHNFTTSEYVSYTKGSLPGIKDIEIFAMAEPREKSDRQFAQKWEEAVQHLRHKNLIVADATQSSDQFVQLTRKGSAARADKPLVGVSSWETYLAALELETGGKIDAVVAQYLQESYHAFEQDLMLAATFMLGAASERALYILASIVDKLGGDTKQSERLEKLSRVRDVKEWIVDQLPALRRRYAGHKSVFADIQDKIETLFTLYRYQRNEVGHPRDEELTVEPEKIKALLAAFGLYLQAIAKIAGVPVA